MVYLNYVFLDILLRLSDIHCLLSFDEWDRVALLAFHLALVHNPQDSLAVLAFASILYHGEWNEGIRFARENSRVQVNFIPEISRSLEFKSNEELAKEVSQLASSVQISVEALIEKESLAESMSRYPVFPCSGLVSTPH